MPGTLGPYSGFLASLVIFGKVAGGAALLPLPSLAASPVLR